MRYFLLTAGYRYYPDSGDGDWVKCYETYEEALAVGEKIKEDRSVDWFKVIDLREWIDGNRHE